MSRITISKEDFDSIQIGDRIQTTWTCGFDDEKCGESIVYRIRDDKVFSLFEKRYDGLRGGALSGNLTTEDVNWLIEKGLIKSLEDTESRIFNSSYYNIESIVEQVNKEGIVYD